MASSDNSETLNARGPTPVEGSGLEVATGERERVAGHTFRAAVSAKNVFLWPALLVVLALSIFPLIVSLYLSVSRLEFQANGIDVRFLGFDNYASLLFGTEQDHFIGVLKPLTPVGWIIVAVVAAITARAFVSYLRGVNVRLLGLLLRAIAGLLLVGLVWLFAQTLFAQGGRPGTLFVTLVYVFVGIAVQYLLGLGLAVLATQRLRGQRFFRVVFLLPMTITPVGVAYMFRMLTDTGKGPFVPLFDLAGLQNFAWVNDPWGARIAVMIGGAAPILIQGLADEGSTNSLRLDSQGNMFASTSFFDNAIEIPTDGSATTTFGSGSDFSHGIATNGAGTVFIGKPGVGSVVKVVGGVQTTVASGLDYPQGLAIFPSISAASRQSSTTALTTTSSMTVSTITTVHLKATVSSAGSTGGLVQFSSNQQPLGNAVPTSGGVASFNTTLPAGTDKVTATFLGNTASYPSISSTLTFTLNQLASHTALTTGSPSSIPGDQMVHVTATVTGSHSRIPTGEVEFKIGSRIMAVGTLDGTGVTTQSFFLPPGTSNVVAHYLGDPIFKGSKSNAITFTTTPPYTPSITTKVSYGTPRLNQSVKVTILVTVKGVVGNGAPTGSVTADSSFVCTALTPGTGISSTAKCTHVVPFGTLETVTVTYSGDSTYDGGTATAQVENGGG